MRNAGANKLFLDGAIALAEMEHNGMRVDVDYLDRTIADVAGKIQRQTERLKRCEEFKLQTRRFGAKANLTSRPQLAEVLFNDMGHKCHAHTKTGQPQLDEAALERIGSRYTKEVLKLGKMEKLHGTYLLGIRREVQGEFIHAFFGLNWVRSFRGSCDTPNLQNVPVRNPYIAKLIRTAFIPREGHAIVEQDYGGAEVRVACSVSGDEKLTYDVVHGDMHADMAAECFMLTKEQMTKEIRHIGKNGFVFAEFYGDWFMSICQSMWNMLATDNVKTAQGVPVIEHLASKGITSLGACNPKEDPKDGTFEAHIKSVEKKFWGDRYSVYDGVRNSWLKDYDRKGHIDIVTGFRCQGPMSKNEVLNYHIQGPAFHCLLWSLTRLTQEIKRLGMKTKLIGQIHDSIIADVPLDELDDYVALAKDVSTNQLSKAWDWVKVPMIVDAEVAFDSWFDKKPYEVAA